MERSANGATGYPPGSIAEQRCRREMEQQYESMEAALAEIRAICRAEGIDLGTTTDSVRMLATRARKWAESGAEVDSQLGNPDPEDITPYSLESDVESLVAAVFRAIPPGQRLVFEGPA